MCVYAFLRVCVCVCACVHAYESVYKCVNVSVCVCKYVGTSPMRSCTPEVKAQSRAR